MTPQDDLLATAARQTFPPAELARIIGVNAGDKQLALDPGHSSGTLGRWLDEDTVIRIGEKPLPETLTRRVGQA